MSDSETALSKPKAHHPVIWGLSAIGLFVIVGAVAIWAWVGHTALPTGQSGGVGDPPPRASSGVGVTDLLNQSQALRTQKRYREAEILLTKAVQTDHDDIRVWRALASVQRDMSATSLNAGNLLSAAQEVDRARASVNALTGVLIDPKLPSVDPKIVLDEEKANTLAADAVRAAIDLACQGYIANADRCANDAFHSSWNVLALGIRDVKNDRGKVVEGLKHLKMVFELGPWASERTRTSTNEVYSKLKKLVYPDEWNDLLARAGFDPVSRDTLKKWGLE